MVRFITGLPLVARSELQKESSSAKSCAPIFANPYAITTYGDEKKSRPSKTKSATYMKMRGHTAESAAQSTQCPIEVIQLAINGGLPPVVVKAIESLIPELPPPEPPTRSDVIRAARGNRTEEEQATLCDSSPGMYTLVERGLCQPLSPRIFARGLGLRPEQVCAPMRNELYHTRVARGISQQSAANAIGISQSQLSKIENGMCTRRDVEKVQAFLDGKEIPEKPIDKYAYLRDKHELTVADIVSITGMSTEQATYGCPELDLFFEKLESQ
jgi:transcriptional regulator with XRE-family HTH domain